MDAFFTIIIFLATITVSLSSGVQLYKGTENEFAGEQGYVLYAGALGTTSFISGSDWGYGDAMVVCRELGMWLCFTWACLLVMSLLRFYGCCFIQE